MGVSRYRASRPELDEGGRTCIEVLIGGVHTRDETLGGMKPFKYLVLLGHIKDHILWDAHLAFARPLHAFDVPSEKFEQTCVFHPTGMDTLSVLLVGVDVRTEKVGPCAGQFGKDGGGEHIFIRHNGSAGVSPSCFGGLAPLGRGTGTW
jgi:hypothetical protein